MININNQGYKEVRCINCRKLLAYEYIYSGRLLIKCPKCKELNTIKYKTPKGLLKRLINEEENAYNKDINKLPLKGGDF